MKLYRIREIILTILFFLFLLPYSISLGSGGVSANYLYVFFPIATIIMFGKVQLPSNIYLTIFIFYICIFILSFILAPDDYIFRRVASFLVFISMFSFAFINIDQQMIYSFKKAIVIMATYISLKSIYLYLYFGGNDLGFSAKGIIGSQRYGFVILIAFWLVLLWRADGIRLLWKMLLITTMILGLALTFSRSSIVALIGSLVAYFLYQQYYGSYNGNKNIKNFFLVFLFFILVYIVNIYYPVLGEFYDSRMFSITVEELEADNANSSLGYRLVLYMNVFDYISNSPFLGSGYLGVWILSDNLIESAHSQYLDVLFRVGVFGFIAYLFLILVILKRLIKTDKALFFGIFGVLIYGLFHETFKLSYGGFIFSFILAMVIQKTTYINQRLSFR